MLTIKSISYIFSHFFIILFFHSFYQRTLIKRILNIYFLISLYVQVDPEKAYSDCMYDYCSCQNFNPRCFCPIFSAYGDECAAKVRPQTTQTAYLLSQGGLRRPKLTRHDMLRFHDRFLECFFTATC